MEVFEQKRFWLSLPLFVSGACAALIPGPKMNFIATSC